MKNGKIEASSFSRTDKEPFNAVRFIVIGDDYRTIVDIELTFEQYGKLLSGRGSVNMKYKNYGMKNE